MQQLKFDGVEVLQPREVPLGGRAMQVRRTLPQRERSAIGAWCFADHYGARIDFGVDERFEHGVLLDLDTVEVAGRRR